jgi:hypothetical protein
MTRDGCADEEGVEVGFGHPFTKASETVGRCGVVAPLTLGEPQGEREEVF